MKFKSTLCAIFLSLTSYTSGQRPDTGPLIRSSRPLLDASIRLEQQFGRPVTYEEPLLVWPDELQEIVPGASRKWNLGPKMQTLIIPTAMTDLRESATQILDGYHVVSNGNRFELLVSNYGMHFIPKRMHDEHGAIVDAPRLLDFAIKIPEEERTPLQHLLALGTAITAASGVSVEMSAFPFQPRGFDTAFRSRTPKFTWDISNVPGRDALIDLLDRSATTFSWRMNCQESALAADRLCIVHLANLRVVVTGPDGEPALRALEFDRCSDCPRLQQK